MRKPFPGDYSDEEKSNWLETIPGKSWFTILSMYGPLEPWINKTWRPGEIELVEAGHEGLLKKIEEKIKLK
jgi:hypothetical protein